MKNLALCKERKKKSKDLLKGFTVAKRVRHLTIVHESACVCLDTKHAASLESTKEA